MFLGLGGSRDRPVADALSPAGKLESGTPGRRKSGLHMNLVGDSASSQLNLRDDRTKSSLNAFLLGGSI